MKPEHRRSKLFARARAKRRRAGLIIRLAIVITLALVPVALILLDRQPPWRTDWFDLLHRSFERTPGEAADAVRIVALQGAPGGVRMQGIWPRDRIAELVQVIGDGGARAIGLDVLLDGLGIHELIETGPGFTGPRTQQLAAAIEGRNVVAPIVLFDELGLARLPSLRKRGVGLSRSLSDEAALQAVDRTLRLLPDAPTLSTALSVHPELRAKAAVEGLIIDDIRTVATLRRAPGVQVLYRGPVPVARNVAMAAQMVRLGFDLPEPALRQGWLADTYLDLTQGLYVPLDRHGDLELYLRSKNRDLYLDGDAVLSGAVDPAEFDGKFVIVTTGFGDFAGRIDTAIFQNAMTGEVIGQMVEQILDRDFLYRPAWLSWAEITVFLVLGVIYSTVFGRHAASRMLPLGLTITFSFLPLSVLLFTTTGILLDGSGLSLALLIAGGFAMATYLVERDRRHQETQVALLTERAERSRLDGELDVARRIQMSLLPPGRTDAGAALEIACHIEPAASVGGDFYDYVLRPDGKVFFSIGDVSGKGVPASLFMALSKSLWKSAALLNADLPTLQEQANRDITRDNPDQMFVTGVGCLYDPERSILHYSGAGHDMPVLARAGQSPYSLGEASGPPFGLAPEMPFVTGEAVLQPGDLICLFTDGLTETEAAGGFYGVGGIAEALGHAASQNADAATAIGIVLEHLDQAAEGALQTDDRTLVIARVCAPGPAADISAEHA